MKCMSLVGRWPSWRGLAGGSLAQPWTSCGSDYLTISLLLTFFAKLESSREKNMEKISNLSEGTNLCVICMLPDRDEGAWLFLPGADDTYERRWRLSRGYDIKCVSVLSSFMPATPLP